MGIIFPEPIRREWEILSKVFIKNINVNVAKLNAYDKTK